LLDAVHGKPLIARTITFVDGKDTFAVGHQSAGDRR
jgi:hypothetical protein